jgi:23S rRNA (adenine2030-N6)-methyltransferase
MNYRHAFHAGNFADVVKHAVLTRLLLHLGAKPAAFRVIDTHAGAGIYDLGSPEALRSTEWQGGIGALLGAGDDACAVGQANLDPALRLMLSPYLEAVAACNPSGRLATYPGSPALVRAFLRAEDRLIACELEPQAAHTLAHHLGQDRRIKVISIDGWTALNAYVPPKERRGLVLIDPPFEAADDFTRLARALEAAHRKWANGIYLLWYPIKSRAEPDQLARRLSRTGIAKILRAEIDIGAAPDPARLSGCGLMIVNPPWLLEGELNTMLPALAQRLARAGEARACIERISKF